MATLDGGELLELFCPICYGDQGDDGHATLVCGHVFHNSCLERSLKNKKECPSCRCPARPLDTGRRDAPKQPKCPCKTGQPIRLYHLQRPRIGDNAIPTEPGGTTSGAAPNTSEALTAALLAASEQRAAQRESRLREALEEERQRAGRLEQQLVEQMDDLVKATAKADRRKQRLTTLASEHLAVKSRLLEDKTRLETRERELSEELSRVRQALHNTRMDLEKSRAALYERDETVLRLKRELAVQRARGGGAAAPHPRELAELLGEHKEDWQQVYSIKVEELRRANETVAELRVALTRSATDAETRVAAERLAGAERVKAVAQERDEVKRELMELEYKLHEAERRLKERPPPPSLAPLAPLAPAAPHGARAPVRSVMAPAAAAGNSAVPKLSSLAPLPKRYPAMASGQGAPGGAGGGGGGGGGGEAAVEDEEDELEALALMAMSCPVDEEDIITPDDEADGNHGVLADVEMTEVGEGGCQSGMAAVASRKRQPTTDACIDLNDDEDAYNDEGLAGSHDRNRNGGGGNAFGNMGLVADDSTLPPSKRRRHGPPPYEVTAAAGADGGAAGGRPGAGSMGFKNGGDAEYRSDPGDMIEDEPVPVLPRAFSGLFSGGRGGGGGGGGGGGRGAGGGGVSARGGAASGRASGSGGAFVGSSFAGKTGSGTTGPYRSGPGGGGGSSFIGEGPDGRGGTNRFPLVSSFTHNAIKGPANKLLGPSSRGGRGGGSNRQQGGASLPASGRIDAFLRPMQPQLKKR